MRLTAILLLCAPLFGANDSCIAPFKEGTILSEFDRSREYSIFYFRPNHALRNVEIRADQIFPGNKRVPLGAVRFRVMRARTYRLHKVPAGGFLYELRIDFGNGRSPCMRIEMHPWPRILQHRP